MLGRLSLKAKTVLDIGTGSGLIALMLAQRAPQVERIDGIELDEDAALQARENAQQSQWSSLIHIYHHDIYQYAQQAPTRYDLIVSNPPILSQRLHAVTKSASKPVIRKH